jgi:hypothetical protein
MHNTSENLTEESLRDKIEMLKEQIHDNLEIALSSQNQF